MTKERHPSTFTPLGSFGKSPERPARQPKTTPLNALPEPAKGDWFAVTVRATLITRHRATAEHVATVVREDLEVLGFSKIEAEARFVGNDDKR